ncbi:hypothetical protein CJ739_2621 [Mariniflexile rhizosphaerae]|uniref:hypothetical protein n=1 Tax=unclassified Mariniflexile TaxID=2643887 RepID=UPI000CA8A95D|nr:hypothetical protein [Mariniflexile sp. TRM1-10]AXP81694.1 hypothetical protein CJ739_2621 [Mariniflexile sp. TRM1-10]PLB18068.1 MAG: hypothetical protein TRG1_3081 [Flavobacteriaceae bacterium FS1-H7996/R]
MVEVFKTNITKQKKAEQIIEKLQQKFSGYKINFDLEDCDNILRVESTTGQIDHEVLVQIISDDGFYIEPLKDDLSMTTQNKSEI